jgi:integrase/recombinase XerD
MQGTETSEKYQRVNLIVVILFAKFLGRYRLLSEVDSKDEIISFLDSVKKDETLDPDKRWIRTWNDYLQRIKYFVRWLHNDQADIPASEWQTPMYAQIKKKTTNRHSLYAESELWEKEDLLTVVKYESHKRNKAALTLLWDLNARNHEIALLRIKHVRLRDRYGEAEIPHESKTGSGAALLMCSFPYVRDWLNEHPFRNEPNARLICNRINGGAISADALSTMMKQLRKKILALIGGGSITDVRERERLTHLTKEKKWNPYCIRHSAITSDSDFLPDYALKKKARWSMNSKQPSRYIKARMGNDLKQKILVQNGIIPADYAKPIPSVSECARCELVNPMENKYCSSCSYPLNVLAYEEFKSHNSDEIATLRAQLDETQKKLMLVQKQTNDVVGWVKTYFDPSLGRRMQISSSNQIPREAPESV